MLLKLAELDSRLASRSQMKASVRWATSNALRRMNPSDSLSFSPPSNRREKGDREQRNASPWIQAIASKVWINTLKTDVCFLPVTINSYWWTFCYSSEVFEKHENMGLGSVFKIEHKKCILWYKWICFLNLPTHSQSKCRTCVRIHILCL